MTSHENHHQSEIPETKRGSRRIRNWTAAGLALGLIAGTGLSMTAASPFSAAASVDSEIDDARDIARDGFRDGHGRRNALGGNFDSPRRERDGHGPMAGIRREGMRTGLVEAASTFLDMSPEDLRAELRDGSTLASIAEEQGKSRDDLIAALLAGMIDSVTEKLNEFLPRLVDGELGPRRTS